MKKIIKHLPLAVSLVVVLIFAIPGIGAKAGETRIESASMLFSCWWTTDVNTNTFITKYTGSGDCWTINPKGTKVIGIGQDNMCTLTESGNYFFKAAGDEPNLYTTVMRPVWIDKTVPNMEYTFSPIEATKKYVKGDISLNVKGNDKITDADFNTTDYPNCSGIYQIKFDFSDTPITSNKADSFNRITYTNPTVRTINIDNSDYSHSDIPQDTNFSTNVYSTEFSKEQKLFTPKDSDGKKYVNAYVYDAAGNGRVIQTSVYLDNTAPTGTFSPNSKSWTNSDVKVTFTPSDATSGVNKWRCRTSSDDGITWNDWSRYLYYSEYSASNNVVLSNDGINKIQCEVYDNADNISVVDSGIYYIDKTKPVVSREDTIDSTKWYNTNQTFDVRSTDTGSLVKNLSVSNGMSSTQGQAIGINPKDSLYKATNEVSEEGINHLTVTSSDNAGNDSIAYDFNVNIDKTNPSGLFSPETDSNIWVKSDVNVTFTPTDKLSGIKKWHYRTCLGGVWSSWSDDYTSIQNITLANEGTTTIECYIEDNAGNSTTMSKCYNIDKTAPTITGIPSSAWTKDNVQMDLAATDSMSGMNSLILTEGNSNIGTSINSLSYLVTTEGIHSFKAIAKDNAGNVKEESFSVNIDKSAPTIQSSSITNDYSKFTVNITDIYDHGLSGTKSVQYIIKDTNNVQVGSRNISILDHQSNSSSFTKDTLGYFGLYKVEIWTEDYVGNKALVKTLDAEIYDPTPRVNAGTLRVTNYDYKENSNIYWIKQGNYVGIESYSSFPERYPTYPTETQVGMGMPSYINGDSPLAWASKGDTGYRGNLFTSNFGLRNIGNASEVTEEGLKKLKFNHTLQAYQNNQDYKLYVGGNYGSYQSSYADTSTWVKTDGDAPILLSQKVVDRKEDTFTVRLNGVKDLRSGLKSVEVKAWVGKDGYNKQPVSTNKVDDSTYDFTVNRNNFNGVRRDYYYQITLTDNVGNVNTIYYNPDDPSINPTNTDGGGVDMLQYNLTAKRIDIYDPREERYVTQLISGYEYEATVEYSNTGELDVDNANYVGLNINGTYSNKSNGVNIKVGETKDVKVKFTAGEENLLGNVYQGVVDDTNVLDEVNENDNACSSKQPYDKAVSDNNPPKIPPSDPDGKPSEKVPIITLKVDLIADYINVVKLNSEEVIDELICEDPYRMKFRVKNNSSLNIKYMDIKNKSFDNTIYYDNSLLETYNITDIGATETKTFYKEFSTPLLSNGVAEDIKVVKGEVDFDNKVYEVNENNNSIITRKKVLALKITNYRITEMVNPMQVYTYPIAYTDMPVNVKSGYNVTFRCDVKGKPDDVYATITDTIGTSYDIHHMNKVEQISPTEAVYEYVLTVPLDLPQGTIVSSEIIATKGSSAYNFNQKNSWDGKTLTIGGNAKEDIIIYRKY